MKKSLWIAVLTCLQVVAFAAHPVSFLIELDGRSSKNQLTIKDPSTLNLTDAKNGYYTVVSKAALTPQWKNYNVTFTPAKDGTFVIGFRCNSRDLNCRMDIDAIKSTNCTKAIANGSFELTTGNKEAAYWRYYIPEYFFPNTKDAADGKGYMRVSRSYAIRQSISVKAGVPVTLSFMARAAVSAPTKNRKWYSTGAAPSAVVMPSKNSPRVDIDGFNSEVNIIAHSTSKNLNSYYPDWRRGPLGKKSAMVFVTKEPASDKWQRYTFTFTPSRNGEVRMMLTSTMRGPNGKLDCIAYDDFKVSGAEKLRNPSFETILGGAFDGWRVEPENIRANVKDAANGKNYALAAYDSGISQIFAVFANQKVTVSFCAKRGPVLPRPKRVQTLPIKNHPKSHYLFYDKNAKHLPLSDKGLTPKHIRPIFNTVKPRTTPVPRAEFAVINNNIKSKTDYVKIPVELLEERGIARDVQMRFGMPLAQGTFFNTKTFRVVSADGKVVPAQFAALSLWADKSIKNLLVQFTAPLKANERTRWYIEAGQRFAAQKPVKTPLSYKESATGFTVNTGVLQATVDKKHFNLLKDVKVNGKTIGSFAPAGLTMKLENGKLCRLADMPVKISIAESGPVRLTLLAEGTFKEPSGTLFDCSTRISFYANSSAVNFEMRFINKKIATEFYDFASLELSFIPASKPQTLVMEGLAADRIFQHNDKKLQVGHEISDTRLSGEGYIKCEDDSTISFDLFKAALRYPKAFNIADNALTFELLPQLPDKNFGTELPFYLKYPFCEGFYRMKWGTGFRENLTIDFAGKMKSAMSVVPVIDNDYMASTKVYQGIASAAKKNIKSVENAIDLLDKSAIKAFYRHMKVKEKQREYGFMNYGDWFGERGRNWTNNEYDFAHGLFMLYLRTGNRDAYRWAQNAAIHQADVDIVHAYPDPAFVGVNAQHGIGHTGNHSLSNNSWSTPYGGGYLGTNGHTWSEGMCEAWTLTGDAATMDSALLLGEHLTSYTAPLFNRLTTHERSAGWSNRAIIGLYRATGDKKYFDASKRLIECILGEQKPLSLGGAWPHRLPSDHGSNKRGTYGNCPYLVGILLSTMREHYTFNPSERLKEAIVRAATWQISAFRPDFLGWPYGAAWDGKGYNSIAYGVNMISTPGVAFAARLSGNEKMHDVAKIVLANQIYQGFSSVGKTLSIQLCMLPGYIDDMRAFASENPNAKPLAYVNGMVEQHLLDAKIPDYELNVITKRFAVRGGLHKEFRVVLANDSAEIVIERDRYGARNDGEKTFSAKLVAPDGKVIKTYSGAASQKKLSDKVQLSGNAGDVFKLLIRDDFKGIWHIESGKNSKVYSVVLPVYSYVNNSISSYNVVIPPELDKVEFSFSSLHGGLCRVAVMKKDGSVETTFSCTNNKGHQPWETSKSPSRILTIKPDENGSRVRRIVISAGGDVLLKTKDKNVLLELVK